MNLRNLPPALFLFLGLYLSFLNCNNTIAEQKNISSNNNNAANICIKTVLSKDDNLGTIRNHACEKISLSETIKQYARGMKDLDYRDCPAAFTDAFKKHREAWLALIPIVDKYPELRGEMHDLFKILETGTDADQFNPLVKGVWDTWAEVEAAGGKD